jgi:hypothetical protein
MRRRRAVARWRTSAAVAALALVATACGHAEASHPGAATKTVLPSRARLAPTGQKPLKVKGTGFQPYEKVRLTANGGKTKTTVSDAAGSFQVSLPGVNSCDSVTVEATGSKGSHADFNLSQIACTGT